MNDLLKRVEADVHKELHEAIETHSLFTSAHHGYAIILEELDELWDEVKKKKSIRDVRNMRAEAVQVAAMAMKFIMSMDADWKLSSKKIQSEKIDDKSGWSEKDLQDEAKCLQCQYVSMTEGELTKLGCDPCNTCGDDCGNWKPKEESNGYE